MALQLVDVVCVWLTHQGEIVRVDPDDAEVGVVSVLTCHLLQDFQEFIAI